LKQNHVISLLQAEEDVRARHVAGGRSRCGSTSADARQTPSAGVGLLLATGARKSAFGVLTSGTTSVSKVDEMNESMARA
jgi:hypothetical protein